MPVRRPAGPALLAATLLVVAGLTGSCSSHDAGSPADGPPAEVLRGIERALHQRARAVRHADETAFTAGLTSRPAFRAEQRTLFENLVQLPLAQLDYRFRPADVERAGTGWWVTVERRLRLEGYDAAPVTVPDRFRFVPGPRDGRLRLASTTDAVWERAHRVPEQPWDLGPVTVLSRSGVLGVFDATTLDRADGLLEATAAAVADVGDDVPYDWPHAVVVYALSDPTFLESLPDLPGGDPASLDAVAFPVRARPGGDRVAATRIVLSPRVVDRDDAERDRLLRHEVTHVAVGEHDDGVPVWLSEGVAEHESVRPMPVSAWRVDPAAVRAAQAAPGAPVTMPEDATFNDDASGAHYGMAWWACEYVARHAGEGALWDLVDELRAAARRSGGRVSAQTVDRVLVDRLGLDSDGLAAQAARLLRETFGSG